MPRLGGKKSYHILMDDLKSMKIGRDKHLIYSGLIIDTAKRSYHVNH
jgi:hypothetical protein